MERREFNIAEKKDDKLTKKRKGKVILVKVIAISNFSEFSLKPGAINKIKAGIKISTIKTKNVPPLPRVHGQGTGERLLPVAPLAAESCATHRLMMAPNG